jgi:hypothetical protein
MALNRLVDSGKTLPIPDVQRTTFSIDAIARFVCNTWDEIQTAQQGGQFDVVVVGSGMYGAYCAAKLLEFTQQPSPVRPRILVLESGPFFISEHFQNLTRLGGLFNTTLQPLVDDSQKAIIESNSYVKAKEFVQHHRSVGGKSTFWGGWSPRLTEADLKNWPQDVVDYLLQIGQSDGYEFIEKEIGVWPIADFINGELFDILKSRAKDVLNQNPTLTTVEDPPIAVVGQSPGSGLFSMDKFSSLPLLLDNIRQDVEDSEGNNATRRLFLVPNAEVLKLETQNGVVTQVVVALKNPVNSNQDNQIVRLNLQPQAAVILAGNTVNSTRLALNSFPRPASLAPNRELMGRNLMAHVRGNFIWKVRRELLGVSEDLENTLQTAALNIRGTTQTSQGLGHFHFQFYAAPNMNTPAFKNASSNPEEFLYRMIPNYEEYQAILDAQTTEQNADGSKREGFDKVVIGIRTCGEMFGDKTTPVSAVNTSWISVNPFGGIGDDVYFENGQELRIPKAFVRMVETPADKQVRDAQSEAAFAFIESLAGQPKGSATNKDANAPIEFFSGGEDGIGTTYHESGTLWIGTDYTTSVTDVNGRFHHVSNAYCVDQSIFPTVGSANPVPTGLALSRKVARSIVERYTSVQTISDEQGFETLYSGNFKADGWEIVASDSQNFFDVQNQSTPVLSAGVDNKIVGLNILWFTRKKFKNFILKLEWKAFDIEANSGIFLRMPEPKAVDNSFYDSTIEIQIDERGYDFSNNVYGSPLHKTGAVYELFPAQQWAAKVLSPRNSGNPGYWNSYEIRVEGNEIEVKLNDQLVSVGTLSELLGFDEPSQGKKKRSEGFIGLQCHTEVVQFRNIRIKEL